MYRLPCLAMAPSVGLPPLEFCLGVRPSQAAKSRPDLNTPGSGTALCDCRGDKLSDAGNFNEQAAHRAACMGGGDFAFQTVERLVEVFNLARQNLRGRHGGGRKCRITFGQLDKLVDAANAFGGDNAELRKMAASCTRPCVDASIVFCLIGNPRVLCSINVAWLSALLTGTKRIPGRDIACANRVRVDRIVLGPRLT